jgi:hypothetical protein
MTALHTERCERRVFPPEQFVKASTQPGNHQIDRRTIEATMKGAPTNKNTSQPKRQYAARSFARTVSKKKALDQGRLRPF